MIQRLLSLFRRKRPAIVIVKSGWEEPSEPLGFPHEFAKWMSSMYPNGFQDDEPEEQSMTDEERIAELERENAALRHELTGVRNTLEAVGREKDELTRDAERWRECDWNAEQMHMGGGWGYCIDVEWRESFTAAIDAAIAKRKETT